MTQHFRGLWDVVIVRDDPPVVAFEDWYRQQWPRLGAWVTFNIGDQVQAEDIAADFLARALARWESTRPLHEAAVSGLAVPTMDARARRCARRCWRAPSD